MSPAKPERDRRARGTESGQVLITFALCLVVLIGISGLVIDVGFLWTIKRRMQTAADAAAIAGATALWQNPGNTGLATNNAAVAASLNGFANGAQNSLGAAGTVSVTVNVPPLSGNYAGQSNFVEVIVQQPQPVFFMSIFGHSFSNVAARAVAGQGNNSNCVYVLDPNSDAGAVTVQGAASVTTQCGVVANSASAEAAECIGSAGVTFASLGVVGPETALDYDQGCAGITPQQPVPNAIPASDPLSYLSQPTPGTSSAPCTACTATTVSGKAGTYTIPPGAYQGLVNVSGNAGTITADMQVVLQGGVSLSGNSGNVILGDSSCTPSTCIYYGGVNISGNAGVTIYPGTYYGGLAINGNSNVTFEPGLYILVGAGGQNTSGYALGIPGSAGITGTGVTFFDTVGPSPYNTYAPIDVVGTASTSLSAPTSGPYADILFYQNRSIPVCTTSSCTSTVTGSAGTTFNGALYFPTTDLSFSGSSGSSGYGIIVAYKLTILGSAGTYLGNNYPSGESPIKTITLYE